MGVIPEAQVLRHARHFAACQEQGKAFRKANQSLPAHCYHQGAVMQRNRLPSDMAPRNTASVNYPPRDSCSGPMPGEDGSKKVAQYLVAHFATVKSFTTVLSRCEWQSPLLTPHYGGPSLRPARAPCHLPPLPPLWAAPLAPTA
jgi:hypothetical protein